MGGTPVAGNVPPPAPPSPAITTKTCLSMIEAGKAEFALQSCLAALAADPDNAEVKAAVEQARAAKGGTLGGAADAAAAAGSMADDAAAAAARAGSMADDAAAAAAQAGSMADDASAAAGAAADDAAAQLKAKATDAAAATQ
jgi:hypothetical protein